MVKRGDRIVTKRPLWHQGEDVGGRLGTVISTESYVLVNIYEYDYNPVKCFQHDVELVPKTKEELANEFLDEWTDDDISGLFGNFGKP